MSWAATGWWAWALLCLAAALLTVPPDPSRGRLRGVVGGGSPRAWRCARPAEWRGGRATPENAALLLVVVGAVALGLSLRIEPGSRWFYASTLGLAAIWAAGAFASGRLHLGRIAFRDRHARPVLGVQRQEIETAPVEDGAVAPQEEVVPGCFLHQLRDGRGNAKT